MLMSTDFKSAAKYEKTQTSNFQLLPVHPIFPLLGILEQLLPAIGKEGEIDVLGRDPIRPFALMDQHDLKGRA